MKGTLEIFVDREGEVISKYSPIGELDFAKEYADSLYEAIGHIVCIADRDNIIAVAGAPKRNFKQSHWACCRKKLCKNENCINEPGQHILCKGCALQKREKSVNLALKDCPYYCWRRPY